MDSVDSWSSMLFFLVGDHSSVYRVLFGYQQIVSLLYFNIYAFCTPLYIVSTMYILVTTLNFSRELLFSNIYEKFSVAEITREVFLESLQSYIQDDRYTVCDFTCPKENSPIRFSKIEKCANSISQPVILWHKKCFM